MRSLTFWGVWLLLALTVGAGAFVYHTRNYTLVSGGLPPERVVEMNRLKVVGYRGQEKAWEIESAYTWTGVDKNTGFFEDIRNGTLFEKGRVVMAGLYAHKGKGDSQREWLEAEGAVRADVYLQRPDKIRYLNVACSKLYYNSNIRKSIAEGAVSLNYEGSVIDTQKAEINHENNEVFVPVGFSLHSVRSIVTAQELWADLDTEVTTVNRDVQWWLFDADQPDQPSTTLNCQQLTFLLNDTSGNEVRFNGRVKFIRSDHEAFAGRGSYQDGKGNLKLQDQVELVLVDRGTVIHARELSARIVTADQSLTEATFSGDVDIQERDKALRSERGAFYRKRDMLELYGNAQMHVHEFRDLIRPESAERIENPTVVSALRKPALLMADMLQLERKTQNAQASGNVLVIQKEQRARAQHARYIEAEDIIELDDQVSILKDNGEWISARRVVAHLNEESFEAIGQVETEFLLERKRQD